MAKINNVEVGQVLYKTYKTKMGNTTMSTTRLSQIVITEVNEFQGYIKYKSGNFERRMSRSQMSSWRVKRPILVEGFTGSQRLATREEIKKMREEGKIK